MAQSNVWCPDKQGEKKRKASREKRVQKKRKSEGKEKRKKKKVKASSPDKNLQEENLEEEKEIEGENAQEEMDDTPDVQETEIEGENAQEKMDETRVDKLKNINIAVNEDGAGDDTADIYGSITKKYPRTRSRSKLDNNNSL